MQKENTTAYSLIKRYSEQIQGLFGQEIKGKKCSFTKQQLLIISLLDTFKKDNNSLELALELRTYIKQLYSINEVYIELAPIFLIKSFLHHFFQKNSSCLEIDTFITQKIQYFGDKYVRAEIKQIKEEDEIKLDLDQNYKSKLRKNANLFNQTAFFKDIDELIQAIHAASENAKFYLDEFYQFVKKISQENNGTHFKTNTKLPDDCNQAKRFRNYMRVIEKMFQKTIQKEDKAQFLSKLQKQLTQKNVSNIKEISEIVMGLWVQKINQILIFKAKNKVPVQCFISDFVRGNSFFLTKKDLIYTAKSIIKRCQQQNYQVIDIVERQGRGTHQILFKIRIKSCVAQFQLVRSRESPQLDISNREYIHSLYEIRRSPLGSIFGLFLFLGKMKKWNIIEKCQLILDDIQKDYSESSRKIKEEILNFCQWNNFSNQKIKVDNNQNKNQKQKNHQQNLHQQKKESQQSPNSSYEEKNVTVEQE